MLTVAVGDIHGRLDLLRDLLAQIDREVGRTPHRLVCLGDYVDRGPDSAGVVALLRQRQACAPPGSVVCLQGNHEDMLLGALRGAERLALWLHNGGRDTLASFGVGRVEDLPGDVLRWLAACPTFYEDERRHYVHAGLNPAFDRASQSDYDRLWIRDPFLLTERDFGRYVVHGHTPVHHGKPDTRSRRVNLDTGAAYGGPLTAALFSEDRDPPVGFLQAY